MITINSLGSRRPFGPSKNCSRLGCVQADSHSFIPPLKPNRLFGLLISSAPLNTISKKFFQLIEVEDSGEGRFQVFKDFHCLNYPETLNIYVHKLN